MPGQKKRMVVKVVNTPEGQRKIVTMLRKEDIPVIFKERREKKEFSDFVRFLAADITKEMEPHLKRIDFRRKNASRDVEQLITFSKKYQNAIKKGKINAYNLLKINENLTESIMRRMKKK